MIVRIAVSDSVCIVNPAHSTTTKSLFRRPFIVPLPHRVARKTIQ
jgi:hypothetical protein